MVPVVADRTSLASHLRRNLEALGLQRRVKTATLQEILAEAQDHDEQPAKPANGNGEAKHEGKHGD